MRIRFTRILVRDIITSNFKDSQVFDDLDEKLEFDRVTFYFSNRINIIKGVRVYRSVS